MILNLNLNRFNPYVSKIILEAVKPFWDASVKHPKVFSTLYGIFMASLISGLIRPILIYIFRFIFSIIFTCLGISYSETLYGIKSLKLFSDYIIEIIQNIFKFHLPVYKDINIINPSIIADPSTIDPSVINPDIDIDIDINKVNEEAKKYSASTLSILGVIVLGIAGVFIVIVLTDYYIPQVTKDIPVIGSISGTIHDTWNGLWNSIYSWIYGSNPTPPSNPDIISRSTSTSSDGSDITIRDWRTPNKPDMNIPTPPTITPPTTPEPYIDPVSDLPIPSTSYSDPFESK
jgi:hypothetical protein